MTTELEQLDSMTDRELVAYWNILQFPVLSDDRERDESHRGLVSQLLTQRCIPHQRGSRTVPSV